MALINGILENSNGLTVLVLVAGMFDPIGALYGMLAGTYGSAAVAAGTDNHHAMCRCYLISAVLHGLMSICHNLHI